MARARRPLAMTTSLYPAATTEPSVQTAHARMRVLVADDDATTRALLCAVIAELGHEIIEAEDGAIAWARFQQERPALAVVDIEMPAVDGLELCRRIREGDAPRET